MKLDIIFLVYSYNQIYHYINSEEVVIMYIKYLQLFIYLAIRIRILNEWDWFIYKMCSKMKYYLSLVNIVQ